MEEKWQDNDNNINLDEPVEENLPIEEVLSQESVETTEEICQETPCEEKEEKDEFFQDEKEEDKQGNGKKVAATVATSATSVIFTVLVWIVLGIMALSIVGVVWGGSLFWRTQMGGVKVSGTSMMTTFQDGDVLLTQKVSWVNKLDYGDVIIVNVEEYPEWKNRSDDLLIKRLIAKEGDSVYCEDGVVYLKKAGESDFLALDEPYAYYGENNSYKQFYDFGLYEIGVGEIFFLGDNRSGPYTSQDSRYQEGKSQLDRLYKTDDVVSVVPNWAIKHKDKLEKVFFRNA